MKKLISILTVAFALFTITFSSPALAGDAASGSKIFSANCAACHAGGNNVIMANKNLKKEALAQYGMNSVAAITTQVTNGKNAMPAFGGRLSAAQIEDVATYVLAQSEKGW
ncbi:cytochrome c6 PetJ [Chamaesiphon minutus]|uniref:Cytochrome c6 n=1 Tax=Chamaesiphon minutus (strain ATCC 27169 / PCC 6605) TaxID=1173020 RepID=K9UJR0_CHAP6|nr:c-type cytochrome [Chamaesiphon minutus]AFY94691.1 cytochrome c, mono- and diheme variants family [Chamaesiphon minutus PCC 6605]